MKIFNFTKNITSKILDDIYKVFGWDRLSASKIHNRNDMLEIGSSYGGWVIPSELIYNKSICYCVGCGEDITFDLGLIEKFDCDIFAFDPTPRSIDYVKKTVGSNSKYHFFDIGLWEKEDILKFYVPKNPEHVSHSFLNLQKTTDFISVKVKRLSNIMNSLGHKEIDLLKIDIEGSEYKVLKTVIEDNLKIKIICVEYDECYNPIDSNFKRRIRNSVNDLLNYGYTLIYAQGNGNYTFIKNDD